MHIHMHTCHYHCRTTRSEVEHLQKQCNKMLTHYYESLEIPKRSQGGYVAHHAVCIIYILWLVHYSLSMMCSYYLCYLIAHGWSVISVTFAAHKPLKLMSIQFLKSSWCFYKEHTSTVFNVKESSYKLQEHFTLTWQAILFVYSPHVTFRPFQIKS